MCNILGLSQLFVCLRGLARKRIARKMEERKIEKNAGLLRRSVSRLTLDILPPHEKRRENQSHTLHG